MKHGYGEYYWGDNEAYEGQWEKDKKHGIGVYMKNGESKIGSWVNGELSEWLKD